MTEDEWTRWVLDYARWHGWRAAHFRPARTAQGWRTPVQGDTGSPDLLLARDGRVVLAELKTDTGRVRPEQQAWLEHLGGHGFLWRPAGRDFVEAVLGGKL